VGFLELTIIIFGLVISAFLILMSLGDKEKGSYLKLTGFFIILLVGLIGLVNPVEFITGVNETTSYIYGNNLSGYHWDYAGTQPAFNPSDLNDPETVFLFHEYTTTENIYDNDSTVLMGTLSFLFVLLGLYGIITSVIELRKEQETYLN